MPLTVVATVICARLEFPSFHGGVTTSQSTHIHTLYKNFIILQFFKPQNKCFAVCKTFNPLVSFFPYQTLFVTAFLHLCMCIFACAQSIWVNLCINTDTALSSPIRRANNLSVEAKIPVQPSLCHPGAGLLAQAGIWASLTGLKIFGCSGH